MYVDSQKASKALEQYLEEHQKQHSRDLLEDIIKDIPGAQICDLPKTKRSFSSCLSRKKRQYLHKQHRTLQ